LLLELLEEPEEETEVVAGTIDLGGVVVVTLATTANFTGAVAAVVASFDKVFEVVLTIEDTAVVVAGEALTAVETVAVLPLTEVAATTVVIPALIVETMAVVVPVLTVVARMVVVPAFAEEVVAAFTEVVALTEVFKIAVVVPALTEVVPNFTEDEAAPVFAVIDATAVDFVTVGFAVMVVFGAVDGSPFVFSPPMKKRCNEATKDTVLALEFMSGIILDEL
jgi:hypothetical protein